MPSRPEMDLGFAFTDHDTPMLRSRIRRDLSHVARRAHREDPHLVALVLTGGFSRGEGTALDGVPFNDYDLVAVRSRPGGVARYQRLAAELSQEVGLEVDVLPVWRARLPHVGRKLFWLDVRLGGRALSGDLAVLRHLRRFDAADVAQVEVARLLGNRAAGMLLSLPAAGETPDHHQRDLQATKAVLAAMDATLLHHKLYAPRMRERLALLRDHPDHRTFATAVEWKLRPRHALPDDWWERARDVLLRAVEATSARRARDGPLEHALHVAMARRVAPSPSQAVRRAAWDVLAMSGYPEGPADVARAAKLLRTLGVRGARADWGALKRGFFHARARTLQ